MAAIPLNPLQNKAREEGFAMIAHSFTNGTPVDMSGVTSLINQALASDRTDEASLHIHDRNEDGDLMSTTNIKIGKSEASGYRLLGAFEAIENVRQLAVANGVRFQPKSIS